MISQEKKDILNEYARTKTEAKIIEAKLDELNFQVLTIMEDSGAEEAELPEYGKLSLGSRRTWVYTQDLQNEEKNLKEAKKNEEREGHATYTEKKFVLFKGLKDNE